LIAQVQLKVGLKFEMIKAYF